MESGETRRSIMKYIRTKDGRIGRRCGTTEVSIKGIFYSIGKVDIIKQADTIEELCDEFVVVDEENNHYVNELQVLHYICRKQKNYTIYGAIWTDKGLIYVAKLNDKGEWELL